MENFGYRIFLCSFYDLTHMVSIYTMQPRLLDFTNKLVRLCLHQTFLVYFPVNKFDKKDCTNVMQQSAATILFSAFRNYRFWRV